VSGCIEEAGRSHGPERTRTTPQSGSVCTTRTNTNRAAPQSAPNYCYRCGNVAAILQLDDSLGRNFKIFREVENPEPPSGSRGNVPYFT